MNRIETITHHHIDVLKEIGNIGTGHSATALSRMLNKKIDMLVPHVEIVSFNQLMEWIGGPEVPVAGIHMRIDGDLRCSMFFILQIEQAEQLINQLMKQMGGMSEKQMYDELSFSALQELGNILTGSYLSALSDLTRLHLYPSVPALSIDMFGAVISHGLLELSQVYDSAIIIDTVIKDNQQTSQTVNGHFLLLPDTEAFTVLFKALGIEDES